ncbi:MAG: GNAT family N-acetyltransferase [Promethearchaeota archaeon]
MLPKTIKLKKGNIVTFRYLRKEDLDDMWEIFNQVVAEMMYIPVINPVTSQFEKENWYFRQQEENNIVIVSELDNHVVGHCMIEHIGWDAAFHVGTLGIIVAPLYRKIGIGKKLIQEALNAADEKFFEKIVLSCFHTNIHAFNLYKKLGFKEVGYRKQQFKLDGTYYDEILMELWLKDIKYEE